MDRMTCCADCQRHLMPYTVINGRTELHCPACDTAVNISSPYGIPGAAPDNLLTVDQRPATAKAQRALSAAA